MEDSLLEPFELTPAELNAVAGGFALAANLATIEQTQAVGNRSFGGGAFSTNVEVGEISQRAVAVNF